MYEIDRKNAIRSSELQRSVGKVLKRVAVDGESLIVERDGYPVAVMLPFHVYEQIQSLLNERSFREPAAAPAIALAQAPAGDVTGPVGPRDSQVFFTEKPGGKVKGHKKRKH